MKTMKYILVFIGLLLTGLVIAQPANDNCIGSTVVPQNGTCVNSTTVAATDSWSGTVGCQSGNGHEDVWFTFTATGTNASLVVTNGTMTGNVEIIFVLANCNSQNCNCPFLLAGTDCAASPNTFTYDQLIIGEVYYYTISSSTGSQGTFTSCLTVTSPPPAPGQDCVSAATICNGPSVSVPLLQLGDGPLEENWGCNGNENNSQWYTFTVGGAGTVGLNVDPTTNYAVADCAGSPSSIECQGGDDYDFMFLNLGASGTCPTTSAGATFVGGSTVGCDFSGCTGNTGFSVNVTDFGINYSTNTTANQVCNQADLCSSFGPSTNCSTSPAWNEVATLPTLVAGNTYAIMLQNYSGSAAGVSMDYIGTALFGPQAAFSITNSCFTDNIISVAATYPNSVAGWSFVWSWGDGSGTTTGTTATHTYAVSAGYTISLTVTDPLGCTATQIISTTCALPIELLSFEGEEMDGDVHLTWTTASETNNDYFTVEKSIDGIVYQNIGSIEAIGNSSVINNYSLIDPSPYQGRNYYRLRQTDIDGRYVTYDPIMFNNVDKDLTLAIFPNPAKEIVNIDYSSDSFEEVFVKMTDMNGKIVYRTALQPSMARKINWQINTTEITEGIYIIYLSQGDKTSYKKIVIE